MSKTITIATHHLVAALIVAALIILLLIFYRGARGDQDSAASPQPRKGNEALILDGKRVPIPRELEGFLRNENYRTLTLTNNKAQVKIVGLDGKDIGPCATIQGTEIKNVEGRDCGLKDIDLLNILPAFKFARRTNPTGCCEGVGPYIVCCPP